MARDGEGPMPREQSKPPKSIEKLIDEVYETGVDLGIPMIPLEDALAMYTSIYMFSLHEDAPVILDAGAGVGYSTLWMAKALIDAGHMPRGYALEHREERFQILRDTLARLNQYTGARVEAINRDALHYMEEATMTDANIIFVDIEKTKYIPFLEEAVRKTKRPTLIFVHNMLYPFEEIGEEVDKFMKKLGWRGTIIPTEMGLGVYYKERR